MKFSHLLLALLLAYVVVVAIGIEAVNAAWGHLLPALPPEEGGIGGGKMRGPMHEFQDILCLLGTWVYPACLYAFVGFIGEARKAQLRRNKWLLVSCAVLCLAIFARFCHLGVFTAGWAN